MGIAEKLLTAEEFALLPPDPEGGQMELVDGRVVVTPPAGWQHGRLGGRIYRHLFAFAETHRLGSVVFEAGFSLTGDGRNVRAPDVAFVPEDKAPTDADSGYVPGAPSLAVEVVSPSDRSDPIDEKVLAYLAAGSERVWVVRPRTKTVTVHRPNGDSHTYSGNDTLTSADAGFATEGFALSLADLFS
jgi:Uma2 family endonuclease